MFKKNPLKGSNNLCPFTVLKTKQCNYKASTFQYYQIYHKTEKSLTSLTTTLKMYNSNVLSTLLYRAQTWQLKQTEEKMLLTASVCEWFFESDGSNKLPTRSAWQLTIHLYQTPSGQNDSDFCVFDMPSNSKDYQKSGLPASKEVNRYLNSCAITYFLYLFSKQNKVIK